MGSAVRGIGAAAPEPATPVAATRLALPRWGLSYQVVLGSAAGLLALLIAIELVLSAAMLGSPRELMYGEAILYSHAHRLISGEVLYQPIDGPPYTVAAYTPLFYLVAALVQSVVGPGFGPGRGLALIALGVVALLTAVLAASDRHGVRAGLLAAGLFLALGVPGSGPLPWTALYKEDTLALALALGSLALVWHGRRAPRAAWLAGGLAALAVLTKQTLLPVVVAGGVWLWWRDRAQARRFATSGLGLLGVVVAGLEWSSAGAFAANTLGANINPLASDWLASNLQLLILFQLGPLLAASIELATQPRQRRTSLAGLLVLGAAGASLLLVGLAKLGGASNHWMPLAALGSVLAARSLVDGAHRPGLARWAALGGLLVGLLLVVPIAARTWLDEFGALRAQAADDHAFGDLVARVRRAPGAVLADPLDVVALADREPLFEPLLLRIFDRPGPWDARLLAEQVCMGNVRLVVLAQPIEMTPWPAVLRTAITRTMVLEGTTAKRLVYVPAAPEPTTPCPSS